jgi:hypothetical protein
MTTRVNPYHRHPSTQHLLPLFASDHLPPKLQAVARPIEDLVHELVAQLSDGPELTVGLRDLLTAKDSLVRQRVIDLKSGGEIPTNNPEPELRS